MYANLLENIVELIHKTSTNLPPDVENKLHESLRNEEPGTPGYGALETILKNVELARTNGTPICQDTGTPIFYVKYPEGTSTIKLRKIIKDAVKEATSRSILRPNAVETLSGKNTGDNSGDDHYPMIHFEEIEDTNLTIELILKGGGCENVSAQYKLPNNELGAGRDLDGVRKVVLDSVHKAQGKGCAPGVLGVAIGGDRGSSYLAAKEALFRGLDDEHDNEDLAAFETQLTKESNALGIGPMGFGGKTTVLGTKVKTLHRLPASYFVSVAYMCWAYRRRKMVIIENKVIFS